MDDGQLTTDLVGPHVGQTHTTGIRGDDDHVGVVVLGGDVVGEHRQGPQVIDRPIEEPLDLGGVQVHRHDPVSTGSLVEVGHEASGDGLAAQVLLVLAGVGVERGNHSDALGRCPLEGVDHDELLHHGLVHRGAVGLDDESVATTHGLLELHVDLGVGVGDLTRGDEVDAEFGGDLLGKFGIGPS